MDAYIGTLIGGLIGFLSSLGVQIAMRVLDRKGKLSYYGRINSSFLQDWGFFSADGKMTFVVPLELECQNTSNVTRVVRDVSLSLWRGGVEVSRMRQTQGIYNEHKHNGKVESRDSFALGDVNGSYSLVVPPRSIKKMNCFFTCRLEQNVQGISFDEIRISCYDERDHLHRSRLTEFDGNWKERSMPMEDAWAKINLKRVQ
ncbi:hypothetical protein [Olsenella phocaeensis]|uniref:hypothetical protein n=1 Tax=Olsenella phocaeensis TaxID=1852385 RepID=UPI0009300871|nr:hypothetical protein [Olsenella phocaeensis]